MSCLSRHGIESRIYFPPAHRQDAFRQFDARLPVTERLAGRILSIPMHAGLTTADLELLADTIDATAREIDRNRGDRLRTLR